MIENPYQSPKTKTTEPKDLKHQSFRLTSGSSSSDTNLASGSFSDAIVSTLIQQLPLLLLSNMLLDGGLVFRHVVTASIAFWILTLMIMMRRWWQCKISDSAILLVKWGYLPVMVATILFLLSF